MISQNVIGLRCLINLAMSQTLTEDSLLGENPMINGTSLQLSLIYPINDLVNDVKENPRIVERIRAILGNLTDSVGDFQIPEWLNDEVIDFAKDQLLT